MRAWIKGTNNDFRAAQYQQFCRDGAESSIILFSLVPILTLGLGIICCCCSMAAWTAAKAGHWDQAIAGNSALKVAVVRLFLDETTASGLANGSLFMGCGRLLR